MTKQNELRQRESEPDVALGREDAAFVERMREAYRAPERSAARNAAFDARLDESLRDGRRGLPWLGGLVGASVAAALVLFVTTGTEPGPSGSDASAVEDALVALSYGYEYAEDDVSSEWTSTQLEESLPNDYVAIESLFLGG